MNEGNGIWLPAEIWALDLPPLHRVFLARLAALSKQDGASWAGDEFLAESLRCTPQHVRKMRRQLEDSGHIVTEGYGHKRRLTVELAPTGAKVAPTGTSNQRRKQPEAQELQPEAQKLRLQMRQEATTVAESIEENRTSKEVVKKAVKKEEPILMPFEGERFAEVWATWKGYKKEEKRFSYKSRVSEQEALSKLQKLSNNDEQRAIEIIQQSIANGWSGFFALRDGGNSRATRTVDAASTLEWLKSPRRSHGYY
jgi:DNA-binding MarR family transcriptional regulator